MLIPVEVYPMIEILVLFPQPSNFRRLFPGTNASNGRGRDRCKTALLEIPASVNLRASGWMPMLRLAGLLSSSDEGTCSSLSGSCGL